jgi:hypothetical protein
MRQEPSMYALSLVTILIVLLAVLIRDRTCAWGTR